MECRFCFKPATGKPFHTHSTHATRCIHILIILTYPNNSILSHYRIVTKRFDIIFTVLLIFVIIFLFQITSFKLNEYILLFQCSIPFVVCIRYNFSVNLLI